MSLRVFTRTIAAGKTQRIAVTGNLFFLRSATAQVFITATALRGEKTGKVYAQESPLSERQKLKLDPGELFDDVTVTNKNASDVTIEAIAGIGDYEAPLAEVSLSVPSTFAAGANVTANAAGAQLLAANAVRKIAWVAVLPSAANGAFVADSAANAAAGKGVPIEPGIAYPFETQAALFVARNGAADVQVNVVETEFA